ncbi:hypothetical protein EYF80_064786 [Liparis tanakae]|uniref:Uncharacterized protein n=1 Tax=Liparis tanakae TaxID=230148 RepID=A0A4Z2E8F8_9TELE|nr:hypothetical protein EYF80_064786 [Liparis tanakae]
MKPDSDPSAESQSGRSSVSSSLVPPLHRSSQTKGSRPRPAAACSWRLRLVEDVTLTLCQQP